MAPANRASPSASTRPLGEQVQKALLNLHQLRLEPDFRRAQFRLENATASLDVRVANQFGSWNVFTRLREVIAPNFNVGRVRAKARIRIGPNLFERHSQNSSEQ